MSHPRIPPRLATGATRETVERSRRTSGTTPTISGGASARDSTSGSVKTSKTSSEWATTDDSGSKPEGKPHWEGKPGQLTVEYEDIDDTFRVYQPVTVTADSTANPTGGEVAAFDLGINTLVACSTTTGRQHQYRGRDLFERFRETTEEIARLRENWRKTSTRVRGSGDSTGRSDVR